MTTNYCYDVEIFSNFFGVTFIPEDIPQQVIDTYIKIDKQLLAHKHEVIKLDKSNYDELQNDKAKLLQTFGVKQFYIWKDINSKAFRNDLDLILDFFSSHKIITGYNSNNYDRNMLDILIYNSRYVDVKGEHKKALCHITEYLFRHSVKCIEFGNGYYKLLDFTKYYKRPYTDYDIQKILYLDKTFTSLKQVAICLKWYRIQDLPLPYDEPIKQEDIFNINDYNVNDVLITLMLKRNQKGEIELRENLSKEFDINFRNLSRSSIGKAITTSLYEKFSGIDKKDFVNTKTDRWKIRCYNIISQRIQFKTPILQNLLNTIKNQTIVVGSQVKSDKFAHDVRFNGKAYTLALGGLHSQDKPIIYDNTDGYIYRDADVASYYPNGILTLDVYPNHLQRNPFRATVGYTKDTRVDAKHTANDFKNKAKEALKQKELSALNKDKVKEAEYDELYHKYMNESKAYTTKAEGLKIAINRMYGAFRDINDYLYDPQCTYKVTINLQLILLMLIEDLELNGIEVISANTDGIVSKFKPEQEQIYKDICSNWEKANNFELEFTDYERYLRNDVNNYIAIKKGFKEAYDLLQDKTEANVKELEGIYIKRKGLFIEDISFNKGYANPVVPLALNRFLIYDIPYTETIENHIHTSPEAIYDYCISQKTDSKFKVIYRHIENSKVVDTTLQKSNRFYVVKSGGGTIFKKERNGKKELRIIAGYNLKPFNDYIYQDNYNLDFSYYKQECNKIINGKNYKTKGIIDNQTTLFGDDDFEKQDLFSNTNEVVEVIEPVEIKQIPIWEELGYKSEDDYVQAIMNGTTQDNDVPF